MERSKLETQAAEKRWEEIEDLEDAIADAKHEFEEVCKTTEEGDDFLWRCEPHLRALHENIWKGEWQKAYRNVSDIQKGLHTWEADEDENIKEAFGVLQDLVQKRLNHGDEDFEDDE